MRARYVLLLAIVLLVLLSLFGQKQRLYQHAWFTIGQWLNGIQEHAINLAEYQVVIEGQAIEGLRDDVSALTFDPDRKTLFTVTNQNPELIELSLEGRVLRRIPLTGFGDAEAVEYISPGMYVISDEHSQRLIKVHVDDNTRFLDAQEAEQLSLEVGRNGNNGFEGLAYDSVGKRLFVARERKPVQIFEVKGFPHQAGNLYSVQLSQDRERDAGLFVKDLSSLQFDEGSGHLLALSDESRLLVELDTEGRPVSTLSLRKGRQGLKRDVPQAEGVALDDAGVLYLVSEPNLFYVFRKQ